MIRRFCVVLAAALLLTGCGETSSQTQPKPTHPHSSEHAVVSSAGSASPAGRLIVGEKVTPTKSVWYLRIEAANGDTVIEKAFHAGVISLDKRLAPGGYRVISWGRLCSETCPTSGETGLGPLSNVCGGLVRISADRTATREVAINSDGSCAIARTA